MKRLSLLFLILSCAPVYAQYQPIWPDQPQPAIDDSAPFTPEEERRILDQLYELRRARIEIGELKEYIRRDAEIDARERELTEQRLTLAGEKLSMANQATALQKERAELYESLYRAVTAGPSLGCRVARVVSLGTYRCR